MQISCLTDGKQPWFAPLFGSNAEADHGRCMYQGGLAVSGNLLPSLARCRLSTAESRTVLPQMNFPKMFFQWLGFVKQTNDRLFLLAPWDSNMQIYGKTRQRPSPIPRMRLDSPAVYSILVTAEKSAQGDPQIKIDRAA
ncbi:hypothetical protein ARSEF1564_002940 [Beauveria bassiana]